MWKIGNNCERSLVVFVTKTNPKYAITSSYKYLLVSATLRWNRCLQVYVSVATGCGWARGSPPNEKLWDDDSAQITATQPLLSRPLSEVTCGSSVCDSWFDSSSAFAMFGGIDCVVSEYSKPTSSSHSPTLTFPSFSAYNVKKVGWNYFLP